MGAVKKKEREPYNWYLAARAVIGSENLQKLIDANLTVIDNDELNDLITALRKAKAALASNPLSVSER